VKHNVSTRGDTETHEADGDDRKSYIKAFNDIKVSYLNLSEEIQKKKKVTRHSHGVKCPRDKKFTPKGSQGKQWLNLHI
jgi:hypothetical protein